MRQAALDRDSSRRSASSGATNYALAADDRGRVRRGRDRRPAGRARTYFSFDAHRNREAARAARRGRAAAAPLSLDDVLARASATARRCSTPASRPTSPPVTCAARSTSASTAASPSTPATSLGPRPRDRARRRPGHRARGEGPARPHRLRPGRRPARRPRRGLPRRIPTASSRAPASPIEQLAETRGNDARPAARRRPQPGRDRARHDPGRGRTPAARAHRPRRGARPAATDRRVLRRRLPVVARRERAARRTVSATCPTCSAGSRPGPARASRSTRRPNHRNRPKRSRPRCPEPQSPRSTRPPVAGSSRAARCCSTSASPTSGPRATRPAPTRYPSARCRPGRRAAQGPPDRRHLPLGWAFGRRDRGAQRLGLRRREPGRRDAGLGRRRPPGGHRRRHPRSGDLAGPGPERPGTEGAERGPGPERPGTAGAGSGGLATGR